MVQDSVNYYNMELLDNQKIFTAKSAKCCSSSLSNVRHLSCIDKRDQQKKKKKIIAKLCKSRVEQ